MKEENVISWSQEQMDYVLELLNKADVVNEKTNEHANVDVFFPRVAAGMSVPLRIDDIQLLYVGCRLLPNIANYLVNILPQLFYPYVVAYLQDLSTDDFQFTINQLYDLILDLDKLQ